MKSHTVIALLAAGRLWADEEALPPVPFVTVAKTPCAPVIDGRLADNEWRHAAVTSGFLNLADGNLAEEKTTVHITFDSEKLYVAFECVFASERAPRAAETKRDGGVHADDSLEVHLLPPGATEKQYFQLVFNCRGVLHDRRGRDSKWNARWQIANDAGMGFWNAEVAVPLADLGVTDVVGQTWRINFARNAGVHTSWSYTGRGYLNPSRWGEVRFVERGVIAKINDIRLSDQGEAVVEGAVFNSGERTVRVLAGARQPPFEAGVRAAFPPVGTGKFRQEMRPNLLPNELKEFRFAKVGRDDRRKLLQIGVATEEGTELYRQAVPWQPKPIRHVELLAEPSEQFAFVRIDPRGLNAGKPVDVQLKAAGGELKLAGITGSSDARRIAVAGWPLGTHECRYRIFAAGTDQVLAEGTVRYERRTAPQWYVEGSRIGRKPVVPKPWMPIRWSADAAEVWGRRYELGSELVLKQIHNAGADSLAAPVTLEVESPAKLVGRKQLRAGDHEGAWESHGSVGAWNVTLTTTIEFDGMMRFDLDLQSRRPTQLDGLRLVIPLRSEHAKYFHHAGSYYARGTAGTLPEQGLRLGFWPFVWLGDDRRGLMWFAESQAGWHSDDAPIEVKRAGDVTRLIVHFVNRPETVSRKQLTFGLQATPVKPVPSDWREWRVETVRPKRSASKQIPWEQMGMPIHWRMLPPLDGARFVFSAGHTAPLDATDALEEFARETHAKGTRFVPYLYLHGVTDKAKDAARYYPFWQTSSPKMMAFSGTVLQGACAGGPFADYLLHGIQQWVKKYNVDGVYFDGAGPPVPCANPLHEHGWLDADGKRQPVYPIFGLREFFKRLWILLTEQVADPIVWVHADGKTAIPCFSFCTANYEGEMVQGPLLAGEALLSELLPPEFWRARGQATQWGLVNIWLPKLSRGENRLRQEHDTLATLLVHGVPCGKPEQFDRELIEPIWRLLHQFGIGKATFHPYWESSNRLKVEPATDRLLASFYERDGPILLIVANLTRQAQSVSIQLVNREIPEWADAFTGEKFPSGRTGPMIPVGAHSFRLLRTP